MLKRFFVVALSLLMSAPALAEETSTNLGIYLFAIAVEGDARVRNVNTEVDLGFDDIVENFDMGYMGYIEHRRGPWSFIGDLAYLRLAADDSSATDRGNLEVELDVEFEQTALEGFAGYRVFERDYDSNELGIDLFIGARHIILEAELGSEASAFGLSRSSSREKEEDWTDTVFAVRLQYGSDRGWGSTFWLDVGDGSDSSSEQFMALASYRGDGNWQYFGGYRYLNLEFDTGSDGTGFGIDLDYTGPMFGANYRM
jgi:hypothetical protein